MFVSEIIDEASEILATTDQNKVFRTLTQAVQILMESGHYFHTNQEVDVCTGWDGQTITLPRGIEVPLAVNIDGSPSYFRGRLFQYNVNKGGMYNPVGWAWDDRGFVSTVMDIRQPSQLIAIAEHSADAGGQIRVVGTDGNNRELRTQLPDGTKVDGVLVPIHAQSDFPYGTIIPDGVTIQTRGVAISPITKLISSAVHQFQSGQSAVLTLTSGTIPNGLESQETYYVGVDDANTIELYQTSLDATSKVNPIRLQSIVGATAGGVTLTDSRPTNLLTSINLVDGAPSIALDSPNEVTFSTFSGSGGSGVLPSPLQANTTYFAQNLDTQNLQVFASIADAQNNANQILLSGNSGQFNVDLRKPIAPETTFKFSVPHYYNQNDSVQAYTNGGTLPPPLIAGQNYFVNVIDPLQISLHTNAADSAASSPTVLVNPITLTAGLIGTSALVKLIPATSNTGTTNQITAASLNIQNPTGTGAGTPIATVIGGVTSVQITSGGKGYTNAPLVQFTDPPAPPVGSNQEVSTTQGYAVMIPDTTGSTTYAVGSIVITNAGQGYTSAPSITIAPPAGNIYFTANIPFPVGTSITVNTSSGLVVGQSVFGDYIADGTTISAISGFNVTLSIATTNTTAQTLVPLVALSTATTNQAHAVAKFTKSSVSYITAANVDFTANTTSGSAVITITSGGGSSGLYQGQQVVGPDIPVNTNITNIAGTSVTLSNPVGANHTGASCYGVGSGTGYEYPPIVTITGGGGTGATATSTINGNGQVTAINLVTEGTGYTTTPIVTLTPSTGVLIEFSSTGNLPAPLVSGTAYRAEAPLNGSTGNFTILNADYSPVTITGSPSGDFYVSLSRAFSIGFNSVWQGDFSGIQNGGQTVFLSSDYLLPTPVSPNVTYTLTKIDNKTAQIYTTGGSPALVTPTQVGVGQGYFAIRVPAYAKVYIPVDGSTNGAALLTPSSIQYLSNAENVQFTTTGTLPYGLSANTNYTLGIQGNNIYLHDSSNNPVTFMNGSVPSLGIGQLSMNVSASFTPAASTSIVATGSIYENGDKVSVRANAGDSLPNGLNGNNSYYARFVNANTIELYDTQANATNIASTAGRIAYLSTGNTIDSTFFIDSVLEPTLVKSVLHVEKPITQGYVSLYAYDYGRSNDMALIGQYHPSETNPKYRRIRIGKQAAWARIIYRMAHPNITSVYDYIPVENARAIMAAIHAVDLEDKDFEDQSNKYWAKAFAYLRSQHESMTGHALEPIQVDNLVYGDHTDQVIDSYYGGY